MRVIYTPCSGSSVEKQEFVLVSKYLGSKSYEYYWLTGTDLLDICEGSPETALRKLLDKLMALNPNYTSELVIIF